MYKFIDQYKNLPFELIDWYEMNHRKLPWRETKDPYKIWLSEIILQQTRVIQGLEYYKKFVSKYPIVEDLASATEEEILKDWQGLGYYSRARNLHQSAKMIVSEHNGQFPKEYKKIKALKGVGDYTAAAVASFAFDESYAVLDGNVFRFLSRYFGIETAIDSTKGKKEFAELAQKLIPSDQAAIYNQAIMEFGALQCTPKSPSCEQCPIRKNCYAYKEGKFDQLPKKEKKIKQKDRFLHYFILQKDDQLLLNKRDKKGIWQNLYDFPCIETKEVVSQINKLFDHTDFKQLMKDANYQFEGESDQRKHLLSHQRLHAKFYHFTLDDFHTKMLDQFILVNIKELNDYAIPKLVENYLREETNFLSLF